MSGYLAPSAPASAQLEARGSRFLALVEPVAGEEEAGRRLAGLERRYRQATHRCWAWRLGDPPRERSSDAGEPAGTAGAPILSACRGAGLRDLLLVVVRWYGGVKLGRGGLVRAYGGAAREALAVTPTLRRVPTVRRRVELTYEQLGPLRARLAGPGVELVDERYDERVHLELEVAVDQWVELEAALADLGVAPAPATRRR